MAIFLAMTPVVAVMAWTFLKVGSVTRIQSIGQERRIRALHAAEGALRYHLLTGQPVNIKLNGCDASALLSGSIQASAVSTENRHSAVRISLELDKGFVKKRFASEQ